MLDTITRTTPIAYLRRRRAPRGQVAAIGFVAGLGCVGPLVGGSVEEERCLGVAERVEEGGQGF